MVREKIRSELYAQVIPFEIICHLLLAPKEKMTGYGSAYDFCCCFCAIGKYSLNSAGSSSSEYSLSEKYTRRMRQFA